MDKAPINRSRRRFLTTATSVIGGVGVVGVAIPFIGSWQPSARAKAGGAPVKVNISKLEEGSMILVEWRGKPVYIVHRSQKNLDDLKDGRALVADPDSSSKQQPGYISGDARSLAGKEAFIIVVGICTHLGCAPKYRPDAGAEELGGQQWLGGFFCPCHGSKFDLAGRVFKGAPAPDNLEVPPHRFESDTLLVIGEDTKEATA